MSSNEETNTGEEVEVELTQEQKLANANKLKTDGNGSYRKKEYAEAIKHWAAGLKALSGSNYQLAEVKEVTVVLFINIAQAQVNLEEWRSVIFCCDKALSLDRDNYKALYRKGLAYQHFGVDQRAKSLYQLAKENAPAKTKAMLQKKIDSIKEDSDDDNDTGFSHFFRPRERKPAVTRRTWKSKDGKKLLEICMGDITLEKCDAIVNAANSGLMHGGGVAGAITSAGGPSIQRESWKWVQKHGRVNTGDCAITGAGDMPSKMVVHAVGPIWSDYRDDDEDGDLYKCIYNSFKMCADNKGTSIGIPAIASGIFGFPLVRCCMIMYNAAFKYWADFPNTILTNIRFTNFDEQTTSAFETEFQRRFGKDAKDATEGDEKTTDEENQVPKKEIKEMPKWRSRWANDSDDDDDNDNDNDGHANQGGMSTALQELIRKRREAFLNRQKDMQKRRKMFPDEDDLPDFTPEDDDVDDDDVEDTAKHYTVLPCFSTDEAHKRQWHKIEKLLQGEIEDEGTLEYVLKTICGNHALDMDLVTTFFRYEVEDDEKSKFFKKTLPNVQKWALEIKDLFEPQDSVQIVMPMQNASVQFTKRQCRCLIANAFFCTLLHPSKDLNIVGYWNHFTFEEFWQNDKPNEMGMFRIILNYFDRISSYSDDQLNKTITYTRKSVRKSPNWASSTTPLGDYAAETSGTIEDSTGTIHVDFANKFIGGGVLEGGCVQEEIMFMIKPECLCALLLFPRLESRETVVISGVERFSSYKGYARSMEFKSDYVDKNADNTIIVAIDALKFTSRFERIPREVQFRTRYIYRELNKAYAGFSAVDSSVKASVATGNWGCGVFGGDKPVKVLLQYLACSEAGRKMTYFTFGDKKLTAAIDTVIAKLREMKVTVGQLTKAIVAYHESGMEHSVFSFVLSTLSK